MPELPEVEHFRKYIDRTSLAKKIDAVKLTAPKMLLDNTENRLKKNLTGKSIRSTFRHGKFLFLILSKGGSLMLHFGLTGDLVYVAPGEDGPPRYVLHLHFADDSSLFLTDTRKMGKIALVEEIDSFISGRGYGKDALKISEDEFTRLILKKRVAIKTVLMDQKILAGVGNEFSDEILFQARIHPASKAEKLSEKHLKDVHKKMTAVLKESVRNDADRSKLEQYFFLDNRKAGLSCPRCKGTTRMQTIGGRSSYFCPSCQRLIS